MFFHVKYLAQAYPVPGMPEFSLASTIVVLDSTEAVLAGYEPEHSSIIKVAMHCADIIDMDNAALCSVRDRMRIMTHMV